MGAGMQEAGVERKAGERTPRLLATRAKARFLSTSVTARILKSGAKARLLATVTRGLIAALPLVAPSLAMLPLPVAAQAPSGAASSSASGQTAYGLSAERLEAHVRILADDGMEGREAGHPGYDRAAEYVAGQFRALNLKPAGDRPEAAGLAGYFQKVTLQGAKRVADGAKLTLTRTDGNRGDGGRGDDNPGDGGRVALSYPDDFITGVSMNEAATQLAAPLVFAGFGLDAPERGHNDYAGLDVKGKIVVLLSGTPDGWPSEIAAHYGTTKAELAAKHGAVGIITVGTKESEERRPYKTALDYLDSESMTWVGADGTPFVRAPQIRVTASLSPEAAAKLFKGAPKTYAQVLEEAEKGTPKGFALPVTAELAQKSSHRQLQSANVAAVLEGRDPALRQEYVVLTAHLDGIGVSREVNGDKIYNGALDNATGIATLIETARAFTASGEKPRRSILFLAVTAEEKGLMGADYYARMPTVAKDAMVANVNLDMPVLLYPFKDVVAFGAQHSTLGDIVARAAGQVGIALSPDPMPTEAIFTRSDHYRFVQQGVPSVMLMPGFQSTDASKDGGKIWLDFLKNRYHRPNDDLNQPIDYQAGKVFAEVNFLIARDIANAPQRPTWLPNNFFGMKFGTPLTVAAKAEGGVAEGGKAGAAAHHGHAHH